MNENEEYGKMNEAENNNPDLNTENTTENASFTPVPETPAENAAKAENPTPQYNAAQFGAPQYNVPQYNAPQYSDPRYYATQPNRQYEAPRPAEEFVPDKKYSYEWDGSKFVAKKKKKGVRALACVIGVALIVTMIAFTAALLARNGKNTEDPEKRVTDTSDPTSKEETSSAGSKSHNIVVDPTEIEHGDIAALYENCAPACCTVRLTGIGHGSGFVVDTENGYVVTNHHVIENYEKYKAKIEVVFYDGRTYEAKVVGSDSVTDIAVLQIEAEGLVALPIGDSTASKVGDTVITIGTPYSESLQGTLSRGVISGLDREFEITNSNGSAAGTVTYIQIDAAISSGNSGGPLINMNGQVIGINSMTIHQQSSIFSSSENVYNSLNFAIPMSYASDVIRELIEYGEVRSHAQYVKSTPKLGITIYIKSADSDECRQEYGLPDDVPAGLLVTEISRSAAIYKAGLELYDIITKFNDIEIKEQADLMNALADRSVGDKVTITVYRMSRRGGGQYYELTFNLEGSVN